MHMRTIEELKDIANEHINKGERAEYKRNVFMTRCCHMGCAMFIVYSDHTTCNKHRHEWKKDKLFICRCPDCYHTYESPYGDY